MFGLASSHRGFRAVLVFLVSILCFWAFRSSHKASLYDTSVDQSNGLAHKIARNWEKSTAVPFGHHHPRNFSHVKRVNNNDLAFYRAMCKGEALLEMLRGTDVTTPPPFTAHDWDDNGWDVFVNDEENFKGDYPEIKKYLRERGITTSNEDNLRIEASVERPFLNRNGRMVNPKKLMQINEYMGTYQNRYNSRSGAIIAEANFSPTHDVINEHPKYSNTRLKNVIPPLNRWSDLTWSVWSHFADNPANLRYIIRQNIVNKQTVDIIDNVLDFDPQGPLRDEEIERTFDMGSEEGRALLGTPNGGGTAWLLKAGISVLGERNLRVSAMISGLYYTMIWELGEEDPLFS